MIAYLVKKQHESLIFFVASISIIVPILMQGQQRGIHYFSIPVCLLFMSLGESFQKINSLSISWKTLGIPTLIILSFFQIYQSQNVRAWFLDSPYGSPLSSFRYQVSEVVDETSSVCISSGLTKDAWNRFAGGIAYERGFAVYPIFNTNTVLNESGECAENSDYHFQIVQNMNGEYLGVQLGD